MMDLEGARNYIVTRLGKELNSSIYYHTLEHTLDVLEIAVHLCGCEKTDPELSRMIQTAALFHDAGMMVTYNDHETTSAEIARKILPQFSYTPAEVEQVSELILVTRLPQRPENHAEEIICDADLDNLGRQDFFIYSFRLKLEWELNGVLTCDLNEWFRGQIRFLEDHRFFTKRAIEMRQEKKMKNLSEIKALLNDHIK